MGDFNFPHIQWQNGYVEGADQSEATHFFEATQNAFLSQHVGVVTRFREGCVASRLDLIFTNREYLVDELEASQPLGKSDHVVLTWKCTYNEDKKEKFKQTRAAVRRNYRRANYAGMSCILSNVDWNALEVMSVEETWNYITEKINESILMYVPCIKTKERSMKTRWWNRTLTKEVKNKQIVEELCAY